MVVDLNHNNFFMDVIDMLHGRNIFIEGEIFSFMYHVFLCITNDCVCQTMGLYYPIHSYNKLFLFIHIL